MDVNAILQEALDTARQEGYTAGYQQCLDDLKEQVERMAALTPAVQVISSSILDEPVNSPKLGLHVVTYGKLMRHNIMTVRDLVQRSERDLRKMEYFGLKSLNDVKVVLAKHGLRLGYFK